MPRQSVSARCVKAATAPFALLGSLFAGAEEAQFVEFTPGEAALDAATKLAKRYISDRFLPDKAIDLVDEAASRLSMELQSVPTEIDVVRMEAAGCYGRNCADDVSADAANTKYKAMP